jgi:UrcA family protein
MKNHTFRRVSIIATLPLGFSLAIANAEPSTTVGTRDLDLHNPQDIETLYARISRRATAVCRDASAPWDARRMAFVKMCTAAAIDDAVAHANLGALTALHESKVKAAQIAQNRDK